MKIGIQGFFLNKPNTGIGQYSKNLLLALNEIDKKNQYFIAVPEEVKLDLGPNFHLEVLPFNKKIPSAGMKKTWWEQIQVQEFFAQNKADMAFYPYPANPWTRNKIPSLVTVHDTIPWDRKEYAPTLLSRLKHYQSKKALTKASALICVSKATKDDLTRHLPILKNKPISVIHNGISPIFKQPLEETLSKQILTEYKLYGEKYFLYVGGYDERKNVRSVVKAFLEYVAPYEDVKMVFVGDKAHFSRLYKSLDYLKDIIENDLVQDLPGKIALTGFIKEEELNALYCGSMALINTSLQEGFNLPVVEAASLHVPVICSNIPIHKEVLQKYPANYVSATNVESIGLLMKKIVTDENFHKTMAESSKRCTINYDWQTAAGKLLATYDLVFNYHIGS